MSLQSQRLNHLLQIKGHPVGRNVCKIEIGESFQTVPSSRLQLLLPTTAPLAPYVAHVSLPHWAEEIEYLYLSLSSTSICPWHAAISELSIIVYGAIIDRSTHASHSILTWKSPPQNTRLFRVWVSLHEHHLSETLKQMFYTTPSSPRLHHFQSGTLVKPGRYRRYAVRKHTAVPSMWYFSITCVGYSSF